MSTVTLHRRKNSVAENRSLRSDVVPPLRNGDHLTVPEFERRYWAMPEVKHAELIEGIVVMPSPVSLIHGRRQCLLGGLILRYVGNNSEIDCGTDASLRLDGKNEYQPDVLLRIQSGPLARSKAGSDGLVRAPRNSWPKSLSAAWVTICTRRKPFTNAT